VLGVRVKSGGERSNDQHLLICNLSLEKPTGSTPGVSNTWPERFFPKLPIIYIISLIAYVIYGEFTFREIGIYCLLSLSIVSSAGLHNYSS